MIVRTTSCIAQYGSESRPPCRLPRAPFPETCHRDRYGTIPLFVLALAFVFLKGVEQLTGHIVLGTVLLVLGVFLLTA